MKYLCIYESFANFKDENICLVESCFFFNDNTHLKALWDLSMLSKIDGQVQPEIDTQYIIVE